jgi:hypothetical protein
MEVAKQPAEKHQWNPLARLVVALSPLDSRGMEPREAGFQQFHSRDVKTRRRLTCGCRMCHGNPELSFTIALLGIGRRERASTHRVDPP